MFFLEVGTAVSRPVTRVWWAGVTVPFPLCRLLVEVLVWPQTLAASDSFLEVLRPWKMRRFPRWVCYFFQCVFVEVEQNEHFFHFSVVSSRRRKKWEITSSALRPVSARAAAGPIILPVATHNFDYHMQSRRNRSAGFLINFLQATPTQWVQDIRLFRWSGISQVTLIWQLSDMAYHFLHEYFFCFT